MPYFTYKERQLFYREQGDGRLLLILPGNTASSACYQDELDFFARHYHTVALDFWGTGQSDRIEGEWPDNWWEIGANDAGALVKHLGAKRVVVIGTSAGAIVALLMAVLFPENVMAVVADSLLEKYPAKLLRKVVQERMHMTEKQREFWQFAHGEDWQPIVRADSAYLLRLAQKGGADWSRGHLRDIRCPVLLTGSLEDNVLPKIGLQLNNMATQIPNCRVLLLNKGDHPMMWSQRDDFYYITESFLKFFHK